MSIKSRNDSSALTRLCLLIVLMLFPTFSWGLVWATSLIESGHSLHCNISLGKSLTDRKDAIGALMAADFSRIKTHHQKLNQMDDETFRQFMVNEVGQVAFCHPFASELIGGLPGKNYLSAVDTLTAKPSSTDRKISYGIWAYSTMYRSLKHFILDAEANLTSLPEWDQSRYREDIASAKRLLGRFQGISQESAARGDAGDQLTRWLKQEIEVASSRVGSVPPDFFEAEADVKDRPSVRPEAGQHRRVNAREHSIPKPADLSVANAKQDLTGGALRPTVSAYTLDGRKLIVRELQTVHMLFPSSLGPKNSCFERFKPDYPMFARLMATGLAHPITTIEISAEEASELLKFFESASSVNGVSGFMISDTSALVKVASQKPNSLTRCLSLVEQTSSHVAHEKIVPSSRGPETNGNQWLTGRIVTFDANDRIWQSLMAMLAAKHIKVLQSGDDNSN